MARKLTAAQAFKLDLQHQFSAKDKTHSPNWRMHSDDCCARVWRPKRFPCLPALPEDGYCQHCDGSGCEACDARELPVTEAHVDTGHGN